MHALTAAMLIMDNITCFQRWHISLYSFMYHDPNLPVYRLMFGILRWKESDRLHNSCCTSWHVRLPCERNTICNIFVKNVVNDKINSVSEQVTILHLNGYTGPGTTWDNELNLFMNHAPDRLACWPAIQSATPLVIIKKRVKALQLVDKSWEEKLKLCINITYKHLLHYVNLQITLPLTVALLLVPS